MDIKTEIAVEHFFPKSPFAQIYLEAVANALDAGCSTIQIVINVNAFTDPSSLKISISDDGAGFTAESFSRFSSLLEAQNPINKGLGRLVFLKYFRAVDIESYFGNFVRKFVWSHKFKGRSDLSQCEQPKERKTILSFHGFKGEKLKSYDDLRPVAIKSRIIQEFLPRFYEIRQNGRELRITISVETQQGNPEHDFYTDSKNFTLEELPKLQEVDVDIDAVDFLTDLKMAYRIQKDYVKNPIVTVAVVDNRTISLDLINATSIPSNYSIICLFYSDYFKGKADTSRQRLDIPDEYSRKALMYAMRKQLGKVIAEEIPAINDRNREARAHFVSRFPHLLGYFEEETIGLIQSDEALEIAQLEFFKDQKEILESDHLDDKKYQKSLDVSSRTLTEYILYRNLIIKKLGEIKAANLESEIHDLIIPRYTAYRSSELMQGVYSNNAWLLDDKFMTFSTILSEARMDKLIREITFSDEVESDEARPDISIIFSNDPQDAEKVDVVVVELKKHLEDDKDNMHAVTQLLQRAEKLVENCPKIQRIWYYAVVKMNRSFETRLEQFDFVSLFSKGKVFYREFDTKALDGSVVATPVFVLSFDAIISDAEARNSTFLAILREEMKQMASVKPSS